MTSFDLAEVRSFAADLDDRFERFHQGKGRAPIRHEEMLRHFTVLCREFHEEVRAWGRAVFSGQVSFDEEVERVWREEGLRLHRRAVEVLSSKKKAANAPTLREASEQLQAILLDLHRLLLDWVRPQLAVGPAARANGSLNDEIVSKARKTLEKLPGLPPTWEPADPVQVRRFQKLHKSQTQTDSSAG